MDDTAGLVEDADETSLLLAQAQAGDADAFTALVERHYDRIYRTAWTACGNRADAEDVAQEVCVKLGRAIRSFDRRSAFSTWLYRITLNAVRDLQRLQRRRGRQAQAYSETITDEQAADQEDAATTGQLWAAVRKLPDQQRDAVQLVYGADLSHAEAGAVMGIKEATVSFHLHAARKTLRGLL